MKRSDAWARRRGRGGGEARRHSYRLYNLLFSTFFSACFGARFAPRRRTSCSINALRCLFGFPRVRCLGLCAGLERRTVLCDGITTFTSTLQCVAMYLLWPVISLRCVTRVGAV